MIDNRLAQIISEQPYPLLFVTISGAHLYGFESPDSDYDLRGVHILPVEEVVGLDTGRQTIEVMSVRDGLEIDLVTHDAKKYISLLLKNNGYVLEQIFSPLVVYTTPGHEELKEIAKSCITRNHAHHYLGFAKTQWKLFEKKRGVKPLLYMFRVLLTGIHLMRTGEVETNLVRLNEDAGLSFIPDLIAIKQSGSEKIILDAADIAFYEAEYDRLRGKLESEYSRSALPEEARCGEALNDLLLRLRLQQFAQRVQGMSYFQMSANMKLPDTGSTTCPVCGMVNAFKQAFAYEICPRCRWEDDPVQFANPDYPAGPNSISLNEARDEWRKKMKLGGES